VRRGLDNGVNRGSRKSGLLLGEASLNFFSGQDKRDENSLAAFAGFICAETGGGKIGRQTGQAIAAIDQLFDGKEQELILRHEEGETRTRRKVPSRGDSREIPRSV